MSQLKEHSIGEEASTLSAAVNTSGGGVQLDFLDIRYSVALQGSFGRGGGRKDILKGITGRCTPGRMLAIMGSSGAGKTTLLDILACNAMPSGKVEGTVLVNGAPRNAAAFRRNSCYVLQRDVLLSTATVRESIATSALLKLPRKLSTADKMAQVDRVLNQLGLVECQNTLIGDELVGMKGISGGQRRRVSIGIELVKNPQVIFLDEPTSGLDSEMAVSLVETLVSLSSGNRTVVLTIHQPNSLITSKFDDFLLLTNGEAAYNGPWTGAVDFFSAVGLSCPQYMNPTDFFLNVLQEEPARDALVERQRKATDAAADLEAAGGTSPGVKGVGVALHIEQSGGEEGKALKKKGRVGGAPEAPAWFQASILARRNLRMYLRNPAMLFSEISQYIFMGIFVGLMYLQLSNSVETGVQDRLASIWFAMAVLSFTPSYTAVTIWDRERILLRREVGQSMYSITSWFLAKSAVGVPIQILQVLLFGLIAFFMVGYTITASNILIYLASFAMFQITSESVGVLCAALTKTATGAVLALTFVLLILLSFSGFLVSAVPVYFRWVRTISFLTYAYNAAVFSEFDSTDFVCESTPPTCVTQGAIIPGSQLIPAAMQNGLSPGINLLVLLGITVATRALCYGAIMGTYYLHIL